MPEHIPGDDRTTLRSELPGAAALVLATASMLPVARWGDSTVLLLIVPAAAASYWAGRRMHSLALALSALGFGMLVALPASYTLPGGAPLGDWLVCLGLVFACVTLPWWIGRYRLLRAEQRRRDSAIIAERAQSDERARIADDLHDTLGHELALIAVQAGALELDSDVEAGHRDRFGELREAAVRASERLREVVALTRSPDETPSLDPVGHGIDALVARARTAGMDVRFTHDGGAPQNGESGRRVAPIIHETMLRIVREGLTNAARHAPGAIVDVSVVYGAETVELGVVNDASPASVTADSPGGGHGVPSLRERARLVGGTLRAEARPSGGFELSAMLPRTWTAPALEAGTEPEFVSSARFARRRLLQTAIVPAAIAVAILVALIAVQMVTYAQTALSPETFESLHVGQPSDEIAPLLPPGVPSPPPIVDEAPAPDGADCAYFSAKQGWLHFTDATYRLCFADGALVAKDLLEVE
ncbi:sensor histidine kinase [Agromyces laixinhei]|uniref:sensor histidine kinase n=1 Tax=Agromyces laixinhei TaxID=2585717 RepID=UPI001116F531|nr:histidine kinase [Agromyces laixinhei]